MVRTAFTHPRDGVALATTLFMIVVIGTIIGGALFASSLEQRSASSQVYTGRALAAAEYGQNAVLIDWDRQRAWTMPKGDTLIRRYNLAEGAIATAIVTKLNTTTFLVTAEGQAGATRQTRSRRATSTLLTLDIPQLRVPAAFTGRGAVSVAGSSMTSGADANPTGWDCPTAGPTVAGIATPDSAITYSGAQYQVLGNPPVARDPEAADTSTFFDLGGTSYSELAGTVGTKVFDIPVGTTYTINQINPVVSGGTCLVSDIRNWGDPWRLTPAGPCEGYMPIIHARGGGNFTIQGAGGGGRAQGILLVDGDLSISGNMEFHGLILVRGKISISGTGFKVFGGMMAANMNGGTSSISGNSVLQFSRCALMSVFAQRAYPKPTKERAWSDMF
jgi:hypothetical protein